MTTGVTMAPIGSLMMSGDGGVAFNSGFGTESTYGAGADAFWRGTPGSISLVAKRGDPAPGLPAGPTMTTANIWGMNDSRQCAATAFLTGTGVTTSNYRAVYRAGTQGLELLARLGDLAPGVGQSRVFVDFSITPTINNLGQMAFVGFVSGSSTFPYSTEGVWVGTPGNVVLAARGGDQIAGQPTGMYYGRTYPNTPVCLGDGGHVAFRMDAYGTGVTGSTSTALFAGLPGNVRLVARDGTRLPGTPVGVVAGFLGLNDPTVNSSGQVAFTATLAGVGVDDTNQRGLWAGRPGRCGSLLVRVLR
ncbi:MAG: hypothetical protein QM783_20510 [Phycisphaerales bacterium]